MMTYRRVPDRIGLMKHSFIYLFDWLIGWLSKQVLITFYFQEICLVPGHKLEKDTDQSCILKHNNNLKKHLTNN